jgi:glycosyltransferase 2 family protein
MDEMTLPRKKIPGWLLALTLALAAGLLYFSLRKVDWAELAVTLSRGNLAFLALACCSLSLSCLARGLRWRVLLSAEKPLPPLMVFWANMTGYLGNSYFPARLGEIIRSVLIGEKGGISKTFALATALTERIMDAVILVTISTLALTTLPSLPPSLTKALSGMAYVGVAGLLIILVAPRISGLIQRIINALPLPAALRQKLCGLALSFLTGAGALQHWGRLAQFLLFSAAIWSLDTVTGLLTASAFGLVLNPAQVIILLAALGIASALPSTPGYVGVYQFVAVTVLVPFGLSEAQAIAFILAYQGVTYIVVTLWGLIGSWKLRGAVRFSV